MTQNFATTDLKVMQKKVKTALKGESGWVNFNSTTTDSYWVTFETFKQLAKKGMLK